MYQLTGNVDECCTKCDDSISKETKGFCGNISGYPYVLFPWSFQHTNFLRNILFFAVHLSVSKTADTSGSMLHPCRPCPDSQLLPCATALPTQRLGLVNLPDHLTVGTAAEG